MIKHLLAFFMIASLVGSCAPGTATPTPSPTATVLPTITSSPSPSATPTITPYPSLQTQGPYLLFLTDSNNLTMLDADGQGRKTFQLPNEGFIRDLKNAISPDGKWLAYFTGSSREEPYDLALHLFNLEDQTIIPVADLVAPGFPENLEPVKTSDPVELESCNSGPCRIGVIELAFNEGIESMAWSPDSQSLAFAAQIDGPSSDVYIFSLEDRSIRRLVNDLENVWQIDWAPNGERILYQNSTAGITYTTTYIYIANPSTKSVQSPRIIDGGKFWYEYGWINENLFLISSGGEGAPPQNLRYINVETQQVTNVWPYTADHIVIDHKNEVLVVSTTPSGYLENEPTEGTYLVPIHSSHSKITDDIFVLYEGFKDSQVFGWRGDQIYSILFDGSTSLIGPSHWNEFQPPLASPNQTWIFLREDQNRITLYSAETFEKTKAWDFDEYIYKISWRPDSMGVFLSTEKYIYYLSIPNGDPIRLQDCAPNEHCLYKDFIWLP
jgi:dipeptidyl aminopeptidase/acylaminoacyl peptidase